VTTLHDIKLLDFLLREDPLLFRAAKAYLDIKQRHGDEKSFEVSSESLSRCAASVSRIALTCMKKTDACRIFRLLGIETEARRYMFRNNRDNCFGIGVASYKDRPLLRETRYKLYNYYHRAQDQSNPAGHVTAIASRLCLDTARIASDIRCFQNIRMSAVDLYETGKKGLKIYYGPFPTDSLTTACASVLKKGVLKTYERWRKIGWLPQKVMLAIRYQQKGSRSVRTDFPFDSSDVTTLIRRFDKTQAAQRLYQVLLSVANTIRITYICIDMDKRPRTQFYFEVL